jgi:hypothetical protein
MTNEEINARLADRTAMLLAEWAGLTTSAKAQIGDGMGTAFMLLAGVVKDTPPPSDARGRITAYVLNAISTKNGYLSYDVDYSPGYALRELAEACDIRSSWPAKSHMSVSKVCSDGSGANSVSVATGYGAYDISHYLMDDGWLVARVSIPHELHALVRKGIDAGEVGANVARFEAF